MANNLKDHLKEVADAIRAKKGTSDLINPQDFATEIESIDGGGGESGGSDWHYFDVSNNNNQAQMTIIQYATVIKCFAEDLGGMSIVPTGIDFLLSGLVKATTAIAIDYSIEMIAMGTKTTIGQSLPNAPWFGNFPEITKEEFYSLD